MEKPVYRNALRSKKMIQDAFLALMLKKDLVDIRTREVIELANISKGTFYAHYSCLYDVQHALEDQQLTLLFHIFEEQSPALVLESLYPLFLCGLKEMAQNRELFRLLFRSSYGDSFLRKLKDTFLNYLLSCHEVAAFFDHGDQARTYLTYVAGGAIIVIQEWLAVENPTPPEEVARFLSDCALEGIRGIKKGDKP